MLSSCEFSEPRGGITGLDQNAQAAWPVLLQSDRHVQPLAGPRGFLITSERQVAAPFAGAFSEAEGNSVAGPCRQEVAANWAAVAGR